MKENWERLNSIEKFKDRLLSIKHDRYYFKKKNNEKDYTVIHTNDWVNIIPLTKKNEIILIRQYRHGTEEVVIEIPGGVVETKDFSPEVAAKRELLEETGYTSENFIHLGTVKPNPAIQNNRCHIFLAKDIVKISEQNLDPHEAIEIFFVKKDDIEKMIYSGKIDHSLVIDAFCLLNLYEKFITRHK